MTEELSGFSGVTIVIFIACGILTFFVLFLFAKREITRFALRNRRGPHVPIGHDVPKVLRREIDSRLNRITEIRLEPKSLLTDQEHATERTPERRSTSLHMRMKAVDAIKKFEEQLNEKYPFATRKPTEALRSYFIGVLVGGSPGNKKTKLIHNLCDSFEHARHSPKEYGTEEFAQLSATVTELQQG